jgi:hypothetical protein
MKTRTNFLRNLGLSFIAAATLVTFSLPSIVFAAQANTSTTDSAAVQKAKGLAFCAAINATGGTISAKMTTLQTRLMETQMTRNTTRETARNTWQQALTTAQTKANQARETAFVRLQATARNEAQKTAILAYEDAIRAAVSTRLTANNEVRNTYRLNVDSLTNDNTATVNGQVLAFMNAVQAAIGNAKTGCQANSGDGAQIRTTFQNALKLARETYQTQRTGDSKLGEQIRVQVQIRNNAIRANNTRFLQATQTARQTLLKALDTTN